MTQNLLILNVNKTNILYLASPHCVKSLHTSRLLMRASSFISNRLFLTNVITCMNCLNSFLTQETLVTIVHAFVTSRIHYCNSLLYGVTDHSINGLLRIQNSAVRIVTYNRSYDNIAPILQTPYWLPVRQRIHTFVNWFPIESHPQNSGHPVRYNYRWMFLGSSNMVPVHIRNTINKTDLTWVFYSQTPRL